MADEVSFEELQERWEEEALKFYQKYPLPLEIRARLIESAKTWNPEASEKEMRRVFLWAHNAIVHYELLKRILQRKLGISVFEDEVHFVANGEDCDFLTPSHIDQLLATAHMQGVMDEEEVEIIGQTATVTMYQ